MLVREVLDTFEPVTEVLQDARAEWALDIVLGLVIYMRGDIRTDDETPYADVPTPALAFSLDTIERLARLNCHLDVDQYVTAPSDG